MDVRNLDVLLGRFDELWQPHSVAELNDYEVKIAKVQGEFPRHQHPDTDELFLVLHGRLTIRLDDRDVVLGPGELFVVPKGVYHAPQADEVTSIVLIEPRGTVNTGDLVDSEFTREVQILG